MLTVRFFIVTCYVRAMNAAITIRKMNPSEFSCLDDFLYEAIYIPKGQEKPDKAILKIPELSCYVKDFGKDTDLCLVAESQNKLMGAIWIRLFSGKERGYGFVDSKTPELSMSVREKFRNQGIGTQLLRAMMEQLTRLNYEQVSLSVDKENFAFQLYRKFGFETLLSDGSSVTMIRKLKS